MTGVQTCALPISASLVESHSRSIRLRKSNEPDGSRISFLVSIILPKPKPYKACEEVNCFSVDCAKYLCALMGAEHSGGFKCGD